jgi:hypothetical protein
MLGEVGPDLFPELVDEFQGADFEVAVEEVGVALEEGYDKVFGQEVVECLLADGAVSDLFRLEGVVQTVGHFEGPAVEGQDNVEVVLKEVVGGVQIELYELQFVDFGEEVAGEVEVAQLEGVDRVAFLVDDHLQLELESVDQFVGDVLLGRTVVEEFREHGLELHTHFLFQGLELLLQAEFELGEGFCTFGLGEAFPEVDGVFAGHVLAPD